MHPIEAVNGDECFCLGVPGVPVTRIHYRQGKKRKIEVLLESQSSITCFSPQICVQSSSHQTYLCLLRVSENMERNYHFITVVQITGAENLSQDCMAVDMCTLLCGFVYLLCGPVLYKIAISFFIFMQRINEGNIFFEPTRVYFGVVI